MFTKQGLMGSAAMLAGILSAWPASAGGLYVSLFAGGNFTNDVGAISGSGGVVHNARDEVVTWFNSFGLPIPTSTTFRTLHFEATGASAFNMSGSKAETGWVIGATVGTDLGMFLQGLRGELEVSYRNNGLSAASLQRFGPTQDVATGVFPAFGVVHHAPDVLPLAPATVLNSQFAIVSTTQAFLAPLSTGVHDIDRGRSTTWAVMANAWYDFDMEGSFVPYIGGGLGMARTNVEAGGGSIYKGHDDSFAWQLGAGLNVALGDNTTLDVGYRHLDAGDVSLTVPLLVGSAKFDQKIEHDSVTVGLRFQIE